MILVELESLESTPIRFLPESESESESLFPESLQQPYPRGTHGHGWMDDSIRKKPKIIE